MINALKEYDMTTAAIVAYDEEHDPQRAALLRQMFEAQRAFFHYLAHGIQSNNEAVGNLAERVQGHISKQLLDVIDAQGESSRQHATMLQRLGVQDAIMQATHESITEIARMLKSRQQSVGYRLPPPGHDDPSEDHP